MMIIDSFSGSGSDLPRGKRTPENLLACLKECPRLSAFDMSENYRWLPGLVDELKRRGAIRELDSPYPWHRYEVLP